MSHTGTRSLQAALRQIGISCSPYDPDSGVLDYIEGRTPHLQLREWLSYQAVVDLPVPFLLRELDALCPGSKFILTSRTLASWLATASRFFKRRLVNRRLYRLPSSEWERWDKVVIRLV